MDAAIQKLLQADRLFLTDGGFETWLFFVETFEAPEFAAIVLMDDNKAREAMRRYFERFLAMADTADTGYVLDTNTWRGCTTWAQKLGVTEDKLLDLSRNAVRFAKDIRAAWTGRVEPILVNGVVGPSGDGYVAGAPITVADAAALHRPQVAILADEGVDMISAITMTNTAEAIGIARLAAEFGRPCVVSFTVETDGRLPTGETLAAAIEATEAATGASPLYYMVNCAHPDHFAEALSGDAPWLSRIGGLRANASRLSHAELDKAQTLDDGNPEEFGVLHQELHDRLPSLRVLGGCCGTDHRHVGCISHHVHRRDEAA